MKKKLFLAGLLVAALMTASCSDDISDDKGGLNDSKNEVGYVKVSINLPSASGNMTKANENGNDNFDDGVEAEYNVNDAILAIFEGTSESDATCINTKNLTDLIPAKVGGNITVKYSTGTIEIQKPSDNKKLYALVIANGKSTYENRLAGKKLSDLNAIAESVDLSKIADTSGEGNFLMTNSPISNGAGATKPMPEGHQVTTLVPLTVYDTKAQAEVDSPDQIYLERAVAKVTTSVNGDNNKLTINSGNQDKSKLTGENALSSSENIKVKDDATEATITTAEGVQAVLCKNDGSADSELSDAQAAAILTATDGTIKFYKGGVMYYYSTVIKHFGNNPTEFNGDTANPSYEEDKHLGRYGVVRNNWYELRINSVSGPGEPEIPTIPDEPVDKKHSYINAEINVLSWAKRTDDIDL